MTSDGHDTTPQEEKVPPSGSVFSTDHGTQPTSLMEIRSGRLLDRALNLTCFQFPNTLR